MQRPVSDLDPFSKEYFDDPYPAQDRLREAGEAVWLSRYGVWATPRLEQKVFQSNSMARTCWKRAVAHTP